jgi:flagellar FliL protein
MLGLHTIETGTLTSGRNLMTDVAERVDDQQPAEQPKKGKLGLILGLVAALAFGGGGFYAVQAGLVDPGALLHHEPEAKAESVLGDVAFVAMEPVTISLGAEAKAKLLRFTGQLEVAPEHAEEVAALMPRVLDVLNTYLRAVEVRDLEEPASLARLRAQMLRRVQVVTGEGRVRDLLITEFVLN